MAKNIVFCADGTWNGDNNDPADITAPTNVLKLFNNLAGTDTVDTIGLANEQERVLNDEGGQLRQIAKYLHGVGDSSNWLVKVLGGAVGAGLVGRVIRGYTFLSRNYKPGDAIYLNGFSRGAYTARALAGLVAAKGLLDARQMNLEDRESAYRSSVAVWSDYRRASLQQDRGLLGKFEDLVDMLPGFVGKPAGAIPLITNVKIAAIGVWDTVGSMGIPEFNGDDANIDALRFTDSKLSSNVGRGFQAIAIDEHRGNFTPCIWHIEDRVTQCLFPGAHSDVGGGYPPMAGESTVLSDNPLQWMMAMLESCGVIFANPLPLQPSPSAVAAAHDPILHDPWRVLPKTTRVSPDEQLPGGLELHDCVRERLEAAAVISDPSLPAAPYRPSNLKAYV